MKKYKFKAVNRILQFLLPFLCAADNFAIVFLLCRLGLGILGRIGLADFLLQDPVLDYITKAVLILSVVYSLLPLVMPKGCFLYDDQVVLARYTITALNWKNKIAVPYYMIENAYVQYSSIYWTKDVFSELVPYGDCPPSRVCVGGRTNPAPAVYMGEDRSLPPFGNDLNDLASQP